MFNRGGANELAKNEDKKKFLTKYKEAEEVLEEVDRFVQKESAGNKTFASRVSLINNELILFIAWQLLDELAIGNYAMLPLKQSHLS